MAGLARGGKRVVRLRGGDGDAAGSVHDIAARELTSVSSAAAPTSSAARSGAAA
jgi:hypothetical protein